MRQKTLALIKPDLVASPAALKLTLERLISPAFPLSADRMRVVRWDQQDARQFYAEHRGRFFYDRLCSFMSRCDSI
jgi:nucleoside-diphosphate kinase